MVTTSSAVVETVLQSGKGKGKLHDSVITNQKIELMDITVKIEEMPLTVPCLNHSHSAPVIKTEPVNSTMLKKSPSEKGLTNKKSPRKQIPTRGESNVQILPTVSMPFHKYKSREFWFRVLSEACDL